MIYDCIYVSVDYGLVMLNNTVTWPMDPAYNGTYEVQTSPDFAIWTNVVPKPVPSGGSVRYTIPTGALGGKSFVRLLVTPMP